MTHPTCSSMGDITNGSRWRNTKTGKIMTVVDAEYSLGPRYRYDGEAETTWRYCNLDDFYLSNRWERQ